MRKVAAGIALGGVVFFLARVLGRGDKLTSIGTIAEKENKQWDGLSEDEINGIELVQQYWSDLGQHFPGIDIAWSGALVQSVVRRSNTPDALFPSAAHYYYAAQAVKNRGVPGKYGAYRPHERKIEKDDIILTTRGTPITYDDLLRDPGTFRQSHGDIVTKVGEGNARVIGGNVNNSVFARNFRIDSQGYIAEPNVWAVLKLEKGNV